MLPELLVDAGKLGLRAASPFVLWLRFRWREQRGFQALLIPGFRQPPTETRRLDSLQVFAYRAHPDREDLFTISPEFLSLHPGTLFKLPGIAFTLPGLRTCPERRFGKIIDSS
jgi:hypothetical protein